MKATERLDRPSYQYKKAGVNLTELTSATLFQQKLFDPPDSGPKTERLMQIMD